MEETFTRAAAAVAHATGRPAAFIACCALVIGWAVSGPIFGFSDTWQLVINTGTTIVTFLMVFLIQNTQNRDGAAIQAKLDELIRVGQGKNDFIGIEHLSEAEVEEFRQRCEKAAKAAGEELSDRKRAASAGEKRSRAKRSRAASSQQAPLRNGAATKARRTKTQVRAGA